MDLEQLFTVTDYRSATLLIPCPPSTGTEEENEKYEQCSDELSIELFYSPAASTDYDLTGQILWPVSVLLSHYLASRAGQARIQHRSVVELGAGTGLPGVVAAHFASKVAVTDGNEIVLDLLNQNVTTLQNKRDSNVCSVSALQLVWGNHGHIQALLENMSAVDVVVAADVVQWPSVLEPLLRTVKALLWNSEEEQPVFIVGIVNRAASTYDMVFDLAGDFGFTYRKVEAEEYLPDGVVPKSCQEFGGRETEIYQFILKDRSVYPVLLPKKPDDTRDWTVGKSYENTGFLPC